MQHALDFERSAALRDAAVRRVVQHAEDQAPGFGVRAAAFILDYLRRHGPTSGEALTLACKAAGIAAHDDRAFGGVYMGLSRRGQIVKVGEVKRARGHNTAGGSVWAVHP